MIKNKKYFILISFLFVFALFIFKGNKVSAYLVEYTDSDHNISASFDSTDFCNYEFYQGGTVNYNGEVDGKPTYSLIFYFYPTEPYASDGFLNCSSCIELEFFDGKCIKKSEKFAFQMPISMIKQLNFDLKDSQGNVVFRKPVPKSVLRPVLEQKNKEGMSTVDKMPEVLQEVIQIIPLILVLVVSLVGLRKALRMLSTLLHRCLIF